MTPALNDPSGLDIGGSGDERRTSPRVPTDFYAVVLRGASRYFRLVRNVSQSGLLFENPLADDEIGQIIELEIPRVSEPSPLRVKGEVMYVTKTGRVGVRLIDLHEPLVT